MNKLPTAKRAQILQMMAEGVSVRAIVRMTGASKNTVTKLLETAGAAFSAYMDEHFRNLPCKRVQVGEIWSFIYAKDKAVPTAKAAPEGAGSVWTWTAICADTKLVPNFHVGGRDAFAAHTFMRDLADRLASRVQLTSDGHKLYLDAVERASGNEIDYAMLVKHYGPTPDGPKRRYSPAECVGTTVGTVTGAPDRKHVSTSFAEQQNLSMRMGMHRFTRLTNTFSKKIENHAHAIAIYFMHYNFVRIHQTLRVLPAMAAGVTDKLLDMADLVAIVDATEAKLEPRGPYKKDSKA